ncbi:MAG TPA: DUF2252 family protein [Candidatus Acidoferrum sp.]
MRACTDVVESELRDKHRQMRRDAFLFFRGTYYRWAQLWPDACKDLRGAPRVLAVGDLHVGSFGTWRDAEGRMCWGVDDFDDAFQLPYTNDLVRLAASVKMVIDVGDLTVKLRDGCDAILEGYQQGIKSGGCPVVLAEREKNLERLGFAAIKPPENFWPNLNEKPSLTKGVPHDAKQALEKTLPTPTPNYKIVHRVAGLGSLGQQRYAAIADFEGGCIAREAKAMIPSASVWLQGKTAHCQSNYQPAISSAIRSHDPYQKIIGVWLMRRLSPDSNPIEIDDLPKQRDEELLLHAMGSEAANIHLGTKRQAKNILNDLRKRKPAWLRKAGKRMAKLMQKEWKEFRDSRP